MYYTNLHFLTINNLLRVQDSDEGGDRWLKTFQVKTHKAVQSGLLHGETWRNARTFTMGINPADVANSH